MKRFQLFILLLLFFWVSGCAHVISRELRAASDLSLTLKQVRESPDAHKGRSVVWGGDIVQTMNQPDGTTQIEVFQRPLGWRGEPQDTLTSEGRFLILVDKYLDPYAFQMGRQITVAGEIKGEETKPLGKMAYRYPVLLGKQIYLWEDRYSPRPYYYYGPRWGYPWYPWWGYPYWRWGFGFHYRH